MRVGELTLSDAEEREGTAGGSVEPQMPYYMRITARSDGAITVIASANRRNHSTRSLFVMIRQPVANG